MDESESSTTFFDREKLNFHYLTVEARDDDGRGNRNTVELLIYVTDVNDNPPIFEAKQYEAYLPEVLNIEGYKFLRYIAIDNYMCWPHKVIREFFFAYRIQ